MATAFDPARRRPAPGAAAVIAAAILGVILAGCGHPQLKGEHRELIQRLATGSSTRDRGIIDRVASEVERLETAGELADGEKAALRAILDAANAGDWDRARDLAYALRDGQEPTDEDRRRVAERTLPEMKKPGPVRPGR